MKFLLAVILFCVGQVNCSESTKTLTVSPNLDSINFNSFIYPKQKVFDNLQPILTALSGTKQFIGTLVDRNRGPIYTQIRVGDLYLLDLIAETKIYVDPTLDAEKLEELGYQKEQIVGSTFVINEKTWQQINNSTPQTELGIKIGILIGLFIAKLCANNSTNQALYRYLNSIVTNLKSKSDDVRVTQNNQAHIQKILEGIFIFIREYERDFIRRTKLPIPDKTRVDDILSQYTPKPIQIA